MTITRRMALAAGLAAPMLAAGTARASVGSGQLGDWTTLGRLISTERQIVPAVDRDGIYLFGDSITVATARGLAESLLADGITTAVNAWSGRPTTPAVDALEAWVADYGAPRRLVMALGTNDIFDPSVMAAQIERVMGIVGPQRTVIWPTVQASRSRQPTSVQVADQRNSGWVNAQIVEASGRHPNLQVVDWSAFLAAKPSRLTAYLSDGVHTTSSGAAARNHMLRRAVLAA